MKIIYFYPTVKNAFWNDNNNVLNFPQIAKKNEFIANFLFNGRLPNNNEKIIFNGFNAIFLIREFTHSFNLDYFFKNNMINNFYGWNSENILNQLYNCNYFILEYDNKKYFYWARPVAQNNSSQIKFKFVLDVFFTFNIKMKNDIFIERTHLKRFKNNLTLFDLSSENRDHEQIDPGEKIPIAQLDIPYRYAKKIRFDALVTKTIDDPLLTDEEKNIFINLNLKLAKTPWIYFYIENDDTNYGLANAPFFKIWNGNKNSIVKLEYKVLCAPWEPIYGSNGEIFSAKIIYDYLQSNAKIINIQVSYEPPFQNGPTDDEEDFGNITWTPDGKIYNPIFAISYKFDSVQMVRINVQLELGFFAIEKINFNYLMENLFTLSIDQFFKPKIENIGIEKINNVENEAKLYNSQFCVLSLVSNFSKGYDYFYEFINENQLNFLKYASFIPELLGQFVNLKTGAYKFDDAKRINSSLSHGSSTNTSANFPYLQNAWRNYIATSQSSFRSGIVGDFLQIGAGITSLFVPGGKFLKSAGVLLGGKGASGLVNSLITKRDLLSRDTIENSSSNYQDILFKGSTQEKLIIYQLNPNNKKLIGEFFYKNGSIYNKLGNFNALKQNRYYFNFVKASEIYSNLILEIENNINEKVSDDIKDIVINKLNEGVRFWHYRSKETFKGILNYQYDNTEIEIIPTLHKNG